MGLFNFRKRRNSAEPTPVRAIKKPPADVETYLPLVTIKTSSDGKLTSIDGEDFLLEIPFRWEQVQNENSLEFQNRTFSEQLIITARRTREHLTIQDRDLLIAKIIQAQQDALKDLTSGEVRMNPPEQVHNNPESEGRFYAKSAEMMTAFGVRYIPDRVFTLSLYRYTHQDFGMPFGHYAGAILDLLKIKPHRINS